MFARQLEISRNLKEPMRVLTRRIFWATVYWFYAVWLGVRAMRDTQLGSRVRYRGMIWRINNWASGPFSSLVRQNPHVYVEKVPYDELVAVLSVSEFSHRFVVIYRWWMTSWHNIYVIRKLYPEVFDDGNCDD